MSQSEMDETNARAVGPQGADSAPTADNSAENNMNNMDNDASTLHPPVVALVPDLFFAPRIEDAIRQQGGTPVLVETAEAFVDAVDFHFPVLALLDLNAPGDWRSEERRVG